MLFLLFHLHLHKELLNLLKVDHELFENIINNKNNFYDSRVSKVKMINNRSNLNQFAFHLSNPIIVFFRNISLKILTKNKKFLENYLGKIYKN
jgi:salicylate hydroxylase